MAKQNEGSGLTYLLLGLAGLFVWKHFSAASASPTAGNADAAGQSNHSFAADSYDGSDDAQQEVTEVNWAVQKSPLDITGPDGIMTRDGTRQIHPLPPTYQYQVGDQIELPRNEAPPTPPVGTHWHTFATGTPTLTVVWTLVLDGSVMEDELDYRSILGANPIDNGGYDYERILS